MKKVGWIIGSFALAALAACGSKGGNGTGGQTTHTTTHATGGAGTGGMGFGGGFGGGLGGAAPTVLCDPFTASQCDVAGGESCDWDGSNFSCFPPPNDGKLCGDCGFDANTFCGVGLTCLDSNKCAAFCCNDGDCGAGGKCDLTFLGDPNVGVCVSTTAAPDAGAGGSPGGSEPACSAPAKPPSNGSCYKP
jgi:hypothetical protein